LLRWTRLQTAVVLLVCLAVAVASSLPWLIKPDLQPGAIAPFDAIAPKDVLVQDSTALEQQRSSLVAQSVVQVIDPEQTKLLRQRLEQQLIQLQQVAMSGSAARVGPVNMSRAEQQWLSQRTAQEHLAWDSAVRQAATRMLSQGLVSNLAVNQLRQAAKVQLGQAAITDPAARSLATKVLASTLRGSSNLRTDPNLSKQLIEEQLTKQVIPTIEVRKGDLITRKGEPISPQAYDVLDYFGRVRREPQPGIWFQHFVEALAACGVMVLVMRRERPCLEVRHALLAVGILFLVQVAKLWFQGSVSPLAVLVPPTLVLAEGLGTGCGLVWMSVAALLWPEPVHGLSDGRLLIAAVVAAIGSFDRRASTQPRTTSAAHRVPPRWSLDGAVAPPAAAAADGLESLGQPESNPGRVGHRIAAVGPLTDAHVARHSSAGELLWFAHPRPLTGACRSRASVAAAALLRSPRHV
jgi:membrane-associated HD superfamily phosphohydrolase